MRDMYCIRVRRFVHQGLWRFILEWQLAVRRFVHPDVYHDRWDSSWSIPRVSSWTGKSQYSTSHSMNTYPRTHKHARNHSATISLPWLTNKQHTYPHYQPSMQAALMTSEEIILQEAYFNAINECLLPLLPEAEWELPLGIYPRAKRWLVRLDRLV